MNNKNTVRQNTRKLILASLLLTLSIVMDYFRVTIPIAGAPVFRIQLGGPFLKYVGLLFGPLYGAIVGGLSDVIVFLLKPENGFIWPLTVVAIFKGALIAWIWKKIRNINFRTYNIIYCCFFGILILLGGLSYFITVAFPTYIYSQTMFSVNGIAIWLIVSGFAGLLINVFARLYCKTKNDNELFENYLSLIISIGLPSLIGTAINTFILKSYLYLPDKAFMLILIPRIIEEIVMVLYNCSLLCVLMKIPLPLNRLIKAKSYDK